MNRPVFPILLLLCAQALHALGQPLVRTTDRFTSLPTEPPRVGYAFVNAFTTLTFDQPLGIVAAPGETNRLFVLEKTGRVIVVTNLAAPTRTVFLNLTTNLLTAGEQGLLGLAFHPRYAENGRLFVFRTPRLTPPGGAAADYATISEFRVSATNAHFVHPATELPLIRQRDEASNHNGGDLHFGPDGFLYAAVGDEGGGNDNFNNGQVVDRDFFAGILRLDVDFRPGSLPPNRNTASPADLFRVSTNYAVPADNPFVGATTFLGRPINTNTLRTEFWAVGLRNPWRMSFDPPTGELWIGDVGQDAWEMVYVSRRGANHGWPFREGNAAGPRAGAPAGFLTNPAFNHVPPILTHQHGAGATNRGDSITGGRVYRGARITALHGAYVYGDYVNGNVWALRRDATGRASSVRIAVLNGIAGFGADPSNGDILAAQLGSGRIMRLTAIPAGGSSSFPATLAETGAFIDMASMTTSPAFTAYDVNLPFWSDHALKRRWFHVPPGSRVAFSSKNTWGSPQGTVWMKHFDMEMTNGVPASRRRLETRFLYRMADGVYGITYRWNSPTNAVLVPEEGADEPLAVRDGGALREQVWRYPSRTECLVCHNSGAGGSLSFNTRQLNHEQSFPGGARTNLIGALSAAGYLSNPPETLSSLVTFAEPAEGESSLEWRVRRYLDVNCAFCHQPGNQGGGLWDARAATPTDAAGIVDGRVVVNFGDPDARILRPGDPARSLLLARMAGRDTRRMPPVGSNVADPDGAALVARWTHALTNRTTFARWLGTRLGTNFVSEPSRTFDTDGDGAPDFLEFITGTDPLLPGDAWRPAMTRLSGKPALRIRQPANTAFLVESALDPAVPNWQPLEARGNEPLFRASETLLEIPVPDHDPARYYRVSLFQP